jgi:hypothetical protein
MAILAGIVIAAGTMARTVSLRLDDPRNLAPARLGTQMLHICAVAFALALVGAGP